MAAFGWTMFFTGLMYFDYSWFREQTCLVICPYGRLQSALIDQDTILIGYDAQRGEPRAPGGKQGDCVDCYRCVEVCPTGIDIRNGLQMECIACTRCVDACDDVMRRFDKPEGLVRFDSRRSFEDGVRRSLLRPRVFLYLILGLIGLGVGSWSVVSRDAFHANMLRAKGLPYSLEGDEIRNIVNIHVQNKQDFDMVLSIVPVDPDVVRYIIPQSLLRLSAGEDMEVPVYFYRTRENYAGSFPIAFDVTDSVTGESQRLTTSFRGP
jgi:cytochrome c oxidase accessory protein FixG